MGRPELLARGPLVDRVVESAAAHAARLERERDQRAPADLEQELRVAEPPAGFSIVDAIAQAHSATVTTHPQPEGGLQIEIAFPARTPDSKRQRRNGEQAVT